MKTEYASGPKYWGNTTNVGPSPIYCPGLGS